MAQTSEAPVAEIEADGIRMTISAQRLIAYARAHPEKGTRACLQDLIDFELLAHDALKRGIAESTRIRHVANQAQVRLYLGEDFVTQWTAESMPEEYVEQAYQKNYTRFNKPESRQADHVITTIDSKRPKDPKVDLKAQAMAQAIYEDMKSDPPQDREAFMKRGAAWMDRAKTEGFEARAQPLGRFGQNGRYAKSFTDEVFAHDGDGIVLPPFVTEFGHHVVRIEKSFPAVSRPLAEVQGQIREKITDQVRGQKFKELTDTLAARYPALNDGKGVAALMNVGPLFYLEQRKGLGPESKDDTSSAAPETSVP